MYKFNSLLFLSFLLFTTTTFYSQNGTTPPNLLAPSPEASSLFKFTETPVNLSNGLANINIPIYTIKTKGVSIPINVSYHSRGIQVAELASHVGLGWTLNYGGMVSRQIRGKSDDGNFGFLTQSFYDDFFENENTRNSVYSSYANDFIDFDPDKFLFNFPGHSGKFIFDHETKKPWQQKFSDIKINHISSNSSGKIIGFHITDEKGNIFYFGAMDEYVSNIDLKCGYEVSDGYWHSNTNVIGNTFSQVPSDFTSWHLIKIETYEGEEINFTYRKETPHYLRISYDENDRDSSTLYTVLSYYSDVSSIQYQISEITFPGGRVVFNAEDINRLDLPGSKALNNIEVFNNNQVLKRFDFEYNIITSPTNGNYANLLASGDDSSFKRMFLHTITESNGTQNKPPYEFEYSTVKLPNRFSTSQDNWGYYNGANNGQFMPFYPYEYSNEVDRRVDSTKNVAGLLKKVIYPTGGSTSYIYEQNIAKKPSFLDQTVSPGNNPEVQKSVSLGHLQTNYFDTNSETYKINFTIGENKSSAVYSSVSFLYQEPSQGPCQDNESTVDCNFTMVLRNSAGGGAGILKFGNDKFLNLSPGDYQLEVVTPTRDINTYFSVTLDWYEEAPVEDAQGNSLMLASGKRIKKIIYSDGQNNVKTKEYEYLNPDGSNSGSIFGFPNFYAIKETFGDLSATWKYGSKPGSPLTSLNGNDLAYGYVIEYNGTAVDNLGKTEYKFTDMPDGGTYYEFPYHIPIDNEWLRGKLLKTKIFKADGTGYALIKEIENQYLYAGDYNTIGGHGLLAYPPLLDADSTYSEKHINSKKFKMPLAIFTPDDDQPDGHAYKVYYQQGGAVDLYATIEKDYLSNEAGSQTLSKTSTFLYNYPKHYQMDIAETTVNDKTNKTFYTYSTEVESKTSMGYEALSTSEFNAVNELNLANRIVPIQVENTTVKNGSEISKSVQRTLYKTVNSLTMPSKVKAAKWNDNLDSQLEYHQYDASGNPLEISKAEAPHTVYIWGYDKQYPVAKLDNASYDDVENLSGFGSGFDLGGGGLSPTQKTNLRSLPNALVTTYDYRPLVGLIAETDPNGNEMTYEYDDLNRLKFIRNSDGKILKEFNYKYKNN